MASNLGYYPNQKILDCVLRIFPQLAKTPLEHLDRKFLYEGLPRSGKTKLIQDLYENVKPRYDPGLVTVAGFRTGDLRYFNYDHAKYVKKEAVSPFEFFKEGAYEDNYGIMTIDGERQGKAFPYWKEPLEKNEERNKEFMEIAMAELDKKADVFFIDELGDRFLFSEELQTKIIEKMNDPGCVVLASVQKETAARDSRHFDFPGYVKQMKSTKVVRVDGENQNRQAQAKAREYFDELPNFVEERWIDFDKKVDFWKRLRAKDPKLAEFGAGNLKLGSEEREKRRKNKVIGL